MSIHAASLNRNSDNTLVEQIVRLVSSKVDDGLLRTGSKMPSIRQFSDQQSVSRFTVVEAYDRLVAKGYLESRRGAGFFVKERTSLSRVNANAIPSETNAQPQLDVVWLVRNMFRQLPQDKMPGSGMLPSDWLDGDLIANGLRSISRQNSSLLLHYGAPQGFLPLRQQLQLKLAELEIGATPNQIVTTSGVTQGIDLVAREFTRPGDTIFVDDPSWFLMFASFAVMGVNVVGVPRLQDGPDITRLNALAAIHKPKLYVINSVMHNPTSSSITAAKAFQVLKAAEEHDFIVVEDDIYSDLHPSKASAAATRIASLDQLHRVIYLSGFSKTLAASLRVGFIATSQEIAIRLTDRKMLASLTTPEVGERVVYKVLSEGHYRKHIDRIHNKLIPTHTEVIKRLELLGIHPTYQTGSGLFIWAETGRDTTALTERALRAGILLAPGSLFSPNQLPSTKMRINISTMSDPAIWDFLKKEFNQI
jgi:DNA-binding transcriptional MocR family regulator